MKTTDFKERLEEISVKVDPAIRDLLSKYLEKSSIDLVLYQCLIGGKRLRPALAVICGQLLGAKEADLLYPAASLEILHNSTLIVDDIIDHSEFRRDAPTCWNKFGTSIAQCTSFMYLSAIYSGMNRSKNSTKLVELSSKTLKIIIDGEIKDILFERSGREDESYVVANRYKKITNKDYLEMVSQKTAVLLQASCMTGAICADASEADTETIGKFGYNLGVAFQIKDDTLDIFGDEKEFGKKIGKDIIEKKMGNFVILSAMEGLSAEEKKMICDVLESPAEVTESEVAKVTRLIKKTDAKAKAEETADSYIQKALAELKKLPQNEFNASLVEIANYIVDRKK